MVARAQPGSFGRPPLQRLGRAILSRRRLIAKALLWLSAGGVVGLIALVVALQIARNRTISLPAPTGPFAVGRVAFDWTDAGRVDPLARDGRERQLPVWIWYPADPVPGARPAPYLPTAWSTAREHDWGPTGILMQHPAAVRSHAVANAALASAQPIYPVLILLPGLGPSAPDYTALAEELASHGYVVVGPTITGSATIAVFADGQIARGTAEGTVPESGLTDDEIRQRLDALIVVWSDDARFLLDQLTRLNDDPQQPWRGRLDLDRVGVFGHSFGGATAAQVCHLDARCRAGANLDGYPYGTVVETGLEKPFMFIWSEAAGGCDAACGRARQDTAAIYRTLPHGYQITIRGSRHFNFSDYAVQFTPVLKVTGVLGPIDGARGLLIARAFLVAFFDLYLKDVTAPLLDGPEPAFPEVHFASR